MTKPSKSPFADKAKPATAPAPQRIPLQSVAPAPVAAEAPAPAPEPAEAGLGQYAAEMPQSNETAITTDLVAVAAKRIPMGKRQPRLSAAARPGYHRHWFNDIRDRLDLAVQAGYAFVKDGKGKNIERSGGYYEGNAFKTYLMELPMQFRNEDLEARQERSDEIDSKIYDGQYKSEPGDKRYVPSSGISIVSGQGPGRG